MGDQLRVVLKTGVVKLYNWGQIDFVYDKEQVMFKVWEIETNETLLLVPIFNLEYIERIEQ